MGFERLFGCVNVGPSSPHMDCCALMEGVDNGGSSAHAGIKNMKMCASFTLQEPKACQTLTLKSRISMAIINIAPKTGLTLFMIMNTAFVFGLAKSVKTFAYSQEMV